MPHQEKGTRRQGNPETGGGKESTGRAQKSLGECEIDRGNKKRRVDILDEGRRQEFKLVGEGKRPGGPNLLDSIV